MSYTSVVLEGYQWRRGKRERVDVTFSLEGDTLGVLIGSPHHEVVYLTADPAAVPSRITELLLSNPGGK